MTLWPCEALAGAIVLPAVSALRRYDYDAGGRLVRERHVGLNNMTSSQTQGCGLLKSNRY